MHWELIKEIGWGMIIVLILFGLLDFSQ